MYGIWFRENDKGELQIKKKIIIYHFGTELRAVMLSSPMVISVSHNTLSKISWVFPSLSEFKGLFTCTEDFSGLIPTKDHLYSRGLWKHCKDQCNLNYSNGYLEVILLWPSLQIDCLAEWYLVCDITMAYLCNFRGNSISQHFPVKALLGHVIGEAAGSLEGILQPFQFHISDYRGKKIRKEMINLGIFNNCCQTTSGLMCICMQFYSVLCFFIKLNINEEWRGVSAKLSDDYM